MKRNLQKIYLLFFALAALSACGGTAPQVSGVVAIANFETTACVAAEKELQIRNNNTDEPQRVQGVHFEFGTDDFDKDGNHPPTLLQGQTYFQYFKVEQVTVGNVVKQAVGNMVQEVILPPGGTMTVKVSYNPRAVTQGDAFHNTYLDVVLNGPKLGVMQIELRGKAASAAPGCGSDTGNIEEFDVTAVKTTLSHKDLPAPAVTDLDVATAVNGTLKLTKGSSGDVKITTDGWPKITFPLPAGAGLPSIEIALENDTPEVPFGDDGKLTFAGLAFVGSHVLHLSGLTLTTESLTIDSTQAPNVAGGTISFQGSALDQNGEMVLVVAAPLNDPLVNNTPKVGGGVFGMEIHLKKK